MCDGVRAAAPRLSGDDLSEPYDWEKDLGDDVVRADEEQRELALLTAAQNGGKGWGSLSAAGVCICVCVMGAYVCICVSV